MARITRDGAFLPTLSGSNAGNRRTPGSAGNASGPIIGELETAAVLLASFGVTNGGDNAR